MSTVVVSVLLLGGVFAVALVRERISDRRQVIVSRLLLAGVTLALGASAVWGAVPGGPLFAGVWLFSGLVASAQPLKQERLVGQLGGLMVSMGPLLASLTLTQMVDGGERVDVFDPLQAGFMLACGALLALSVGFWVRAGERIAAVSPWRAEGNTVTEVGPHSALPLAAGLGALFSFRRLASLGPSYTEAYLPVVGEDGQPIRWVTDVGLGLVVATKVESFHVFVLLAAALCVLGALGPGRVTGAVIAVVGGVMMLGGAVWMVSLDGQAVDVVALTEEARVLVDKMSVMPRGGSAPQVVGQGSGRISVMHAAVPLMVLITSGLSALGAGASQLLKRRVAAEPFEGDADRLGARDAAMLGTLCAWLALGAWLFQVKHTTGVWGPVGAGDHMMSGVAFGLTASLMVLYGVRGQDSATARVLRVLAVGLGLAMLVGLLGGGLATSVGLFELSS